jgi:hypothetical protein
VGGSACPGVHGNEPFTTAPNDKDGLDRSAIAVVASSSRRLGFDTPIVPSGGTATDHNVPCIDKVPLRLDHAKIVTGWRG